MKKNISIVTWACSENFGTNLQSYALHEKLSLLGYNVTYLMPFSEIFGLKSYIKYLCSIVGLLEYREKKKYQKTKNLYKIYQFHKEKYNIKSVYTHRQYKHLLQTTDIFMAGSDQIWNTYYKYNPFFFLNFAGNVKRVAYASSIGTNSIPDDYKEQIKEYLSEFSHIGVREQSAVVVLSELVPHKNIVQVLDPTFLLTREMWCSFAKEADIEFALSKNFILCYLIGENDNYAEQLEEVKNKLNIECVIIVPACENPNFTIKDAFVYRDAGVKEFVHLIQKATFVCTDSFHATTLSINLSVNFVEFVRFKDDDVISQNSRIYELLEHYQLSDRIFSFSTSGWVDDINYEQVHSILEKDRAFSLNYLINSIEF